MGLMIETGGIEGVGRAASRATTPHKIGAVPFTMVLSPEIILMG